MRRFLVLGLVLMLAATASADGRRFPGVSKLDTAIVTELITETVRGLYDYWEIAADDDGIVTFTTDSTLVLDGPGIEVSGDLTAMGDTNWVLTGYLQADSVAADSNITFGGSLIGSNGESLDNLTNNYWNAGAAGFVAGSYNYATAGMVAGTADAITINFVPDLPALAAGLQVTFVAEAANTGAATLAVDGGTAKAIVESADGSALEANDIRSGSMVTIVYDGTSWQQTSQSGN